MAIDKYLVGNHGLLYLLAVFIFLVFIGGMVRVVFTRERRSILDVAKIFISGFVLSFMAFVLLYREEWMDVDYMAVVVLCTSMMAEFIMSEIMSNGYKIARELLMGALKGVIGFINNKINPSGGMIDTNIDIEEETKTNNNETN